MTDVTVASGELIPCLSHQFFDDHQEIAETVRDYMQSPCVDSVTWDVARKCFHGNQNIAGIVQEYSLGVSMAYLNIAEEVHSQLSAELLAILSEQISYVDGQVVGRRLEGIVELRKACLFVASNVALFSRNNIFNATPVTEVARLVLTGVNLLHPLNGEDPILKEEVPDEDVLITPTGHKFSWSSLLQFHNTRPYRGREGELNEQKFIVNPVTNTFFPWCDVLPLVIAAVRSGRALVALHQRAVVPPGAQGVFPWASLHDFYTSIQTHPGIHEDSIYMEVNGLIQRKHQENNLQRMWRPVHLAIVTANPRLEGVPGVNASAQEIRTWMHADANQPLLQGIHGLSLRELQMTNVPKELGLLTGLQQIDFSRNQLASFSEDLFQGLIALQELIFYDNQVASLPEGLFRGLTRLHTLHFGGNRLISLPDRLFEGLAGLQVLSLNDNQLGSLPEGLFRGLTQLQTLFMYSNRLTSLPGGLFDGLHALDALYLGYNQLVSLPEGLFQDLSLCQELSLSHNRLTTLPEGLFCGLDGLQTLALSYNQLDSLPERLFHPLSALQDLFLDHNPLLETTLESPAGIRDGVMLRRGSLAGR